MDDALNKELLASVDAAFADMDDDFNTPKAISRLFEIVPKINSFVDGKIDINHVSSSTLDKVKSTFDVFLNDILGLKNDLESSNDSGIVDGLMDLILDIRQDARANKNWTTSDQIRDKMNELNIVLKDSKEGTSWTLK